MAWCCLQFVSKRGYAVFLVATFVADLVICATVLFLCTNSDQESRDKDQYAAAAIDTMVCCIARLILFPLIALIAYKIYHRTASTSPINRLKELEQQQQRFLATNHLATDANQHSDSLVGTSLTTITGDMTESLASSDSLAAPSSIPTNGSASDEKTEAKAAFARKQGHAVAMKKAERLRFVIVGIMFAITTGMSLYSGLKCVGFHYDPQIVVAQATLFAMVTFLINFEFFLIRDFLNKITEEEGELIASMHMHPMFFTTDLKCHHCDICHETLRGPDYVAYRCRTCDFDMCQRCYRRKDKKSAKGYGQRGIRSDGAQLTTWTFFKRIIQLSLDFKCCLGSALLFLVFARVLSIVMPRVQGNIFDAILSYLQDSTASSRDAFTECMVVYLVLQVFSGLFAGLQGLFQQLVTYQLEYSVRTKLFSSILRMDIAFFDGMHTGQLTSRLTNDVNGMVSPVQVLMNNLLANVLSLVGGIAMAFTTSWKLSILALTIVPPITFVFNLYAHWGHKINRSIWCAYGEANKVATECIHNIRTVRGFSTEQHETDKFDDSINTALSHGVMNAYVGGSVYAFSSYMTSGTAVLILWYGGDLVCDSNGKQLTVGRLITFQMYWNMMNTSFISLSEVFNDLIRSSSAAERVCSLIDARPEVDPDAGEEVDRDTVKGHLELCDVQFFYRTQPDSIVLKGVSLIMTPGSTTALVGKSGGGKSTLVHLLMRFYEPTDGKVLLDGRDMTLLSSRSVRKLCGFVAQDTQLFAASIEDNLAYGLGRPYTHEEMVAACVKANAYEFIMKMDEQFDSRAGEKGILLSGGQKQRLAIARCFLRAPRLLFLDEATSALDAENEGIVQQALETLIEESQCTVVLIAHRLSTVINANQIAVIHEGDIYELGSHDQLMSKGKQGIYSQLVQRQMAHAATDANSVMDLDKKDDQKGKPSVQTDIDELMKEMEQTGTLAEFQKRRADQ